jgi:hypothetical protein
MFVKIGSVAAFFTHNFFNVGKNGGGHELDERILNMKYTFSPKYCLHEKVVVHNGGQRQIREDLSHVHVGVPGGSAGDSGHP